MKYIITFLRVLLASMLVTSCANYGSDRILPTRNSYNEALQFGDKQQLLLNIVRLRYNDLPYFFSVNNIISQINYSNTFTGGVNNTWTPPPVNFATSASDSVTVGEAPTITYTPLQGDAFIKKMLTPADIRILYMLLHNSDADIGTLLRIFALQLGPFDNASVRQGSNVPIPDYKFRKMAKLLAKLVKERKLDLTSTMLEGKFSIKMKLIGFSQLKPQEQNILEKLGFSRKNSVVWLVQTKGGNMPLPTAPPGKGGPMQAGGAAQEPQVSQELSNSLDEQEPLASDNAASPVLEGVSKLAAIPRMNVKQITHKKPKKILLLQTRTLFMVITYLSKGVHVSPTDVHRKIASGTRLPNGNLLNWQYFTSEIFEVHCCLSQPEDAFLSVQYRGRWYYIRDDDLLSKGTFYVIGILMNLYEGNIQSGLTPFYSIIT